MAPLLGGSGMAKSGNSKSSKGQIVRRVGPDPNAMTFGEHLEELRRRVMFAIIGLVPIAAIALAIGIPVLEFMIRPVQEALRERNLPASLQATGPAETFGAYLRVSVAMTLVVGAPWVVYQLWLFVAPGLRRAEQRLAYFLIPFSGVLTSLGLVMMWFFMLPVVLAFFIGFGADIGRQAPAVLAPPIEAVFPSVPVLPADPPDPAVGDLWINDRLMQLRACIAVGPGGPRIVGSELVAAPGVLQQYRISEYIKMITGLAVAFVTGFQTPLVVLLLGWGGLIQVEWLTKYRRQAVMVCMVLGAVLTPADPISMVALAVPLYLLFELGVALLRWMPASRVMGTEKEPADAGDA
ncbi:MAG: twin-arginine translocase subunit TatC [Phycisphaerales bacterium]